MASKNVDFWLRLLQYGADEEDRRRKWNKFCWALFRNHLAHLTFGNSEELREALSIGPLDPDERKVRMELEERIGCLPELPDDPSVEPSMPFCKEVFQDDVSFSGRVLVGADFGEAEFRKSANFENVRFLGIANFKKARFLGDNPVKSRVVSFSSSRFHNTANFTDTHFPYLARFKDAAFDGAALFRDAMFQAKTGTSKSPYGIADFARSRFGTEADFSRSEFRAAMAFDGAEFRSAARFDDAKFQGKCNFNNAHFQGTTSFQNASFASPPMFFETRLHEDTNFGQVDWSTAESSYVRPWHTNAVSEQARQMAENAGEAVRAWDRLALIMSQREKLPERHQFFKLKMRALRQRDGFSLPSFMNVLFDVTCDYGWGIRRAFSWWLGHVAVGALILSVATLGAPAGVDSSCWHIVRESLFLSFANAHAFLGLASEGGYLHEARSTVGDAVRFRWAFTIVGTVQAVLGPVLLFLLLLTLRNHFRLA